MCRRALTAFALSCLAATALAQTAPTPPVGPDFSKIEVKVTELGRATYMLTGAGGNVTVAVGGDSIIMVDGQFAPMHPKLKAAIAAISPLPIKYLINTHHHGDHTGGNAPFAKDGVTIVSHVNVKNRLAAGTTSNISGARVPPVAPEALPSRTYDGDGITLEVQGRVAQLRHPDFPAHTDGDTYVYFPDANVLATGDTFNNGRYQNSDWLNGGNLRGMVRTADLYLTIGDDNTKIVPGHGPLATKAQLKEFREMVALSIARMGRLIADGVVKSEADAIAAKPFADLDAKWAANEQAARNWIRIVYHSVKP